MKMPLIEYGRTGRTLDFPVFDVHAHVGNFQNVCAPSLDKQVAEMDRVGIQVQLVSSIESIFGDISRGNDQAAEAAARYPGRIFAYCQISACYPELIRTELERCFRNPVFKGIKVYQVGVRYDDPLFTPAWEFAREQKLPVLAHTWGGDVTGFDKVAERFPEVAFLAGHAGSGFAYQPYVDMAKRLPNFYLDLTYSREHTNMIEYFVEQVGAGQIVWGSDAPTFSISQQTGKVLYARIPDDTKRAILGGTAFKLFKL
ncbi:MAG: amidohydrolase family protein [bacterium]